MTSIEEHITAAHEFIEDINEKIRANLLVKRQKIIGFSASEASTNLFAAFLHKKELITPGFNVNHKFFASLKRANDVFKESFDKKELVVDLLVKQEALRDRLCYGRQKDDTLINDAVKNLFELKKILEELLGEEL